MATVKSTIYKRPYFKESAGTMAMGIGLTVAGAFVINISRSEEGAVQKTDTRSFHWQRSACDRVRVTKEGRNNYQAIYHEWRHTIEIQ
jgi:hypothetical protein